jgi:hypothetical protein
LLNRKRIYLTLLIIFFLAGCTSPAADGNSQTEAAVSATPEPTSTPEPTPTSASPVGVFLTPAGSNPDLVEELNPLISSRMRDQGLRFQVLPTLTEADFDTERYAIVVVVPPYPELTSLAEASPDTKYLAVGFNDLEPTGNISVLGSGGGEYDVQGFIAGYIAAMITDDWRVGVLSLEDNPNALAARDGFRAGVKYYCGLCNPKYAPTGINYVYPKYIDLPVDATDAQVSANIDFMVDRVVNTFYIVPGVGSPQVYRSLVAYQKNIIGSGTDFQEEYREFWVVSLGYDLVTYLEDFWPRFLEAESGIADTPPLLLMDINPSLLSEGKVKLVEGLIQDVSSGLMKTSY